ncbi:MAG: hypothetical protein AAGB22_11480, partial [Bacteroidota bacterium]
ALGIPSSALYGYDNLLPTAVGANNHYRELAFDGFEDYASTYPGPGGGHGHLEFALGTGGSPALSGTDGVAHTGEQSLKLGANTSAHYTVTVDDPANARFDPVIDTDNTYFISAWVRSDDAASLQVSHDGSGSMTVQLTASSDPLANSIEGWHRLEGTFNAPAAGNQLKIELIASSATAYFDDIRVQRMRSQMTSYVYDPVTLWLVAELDANNYATFYNYDEDGALVQVKKETVEGIQTITTNRSNTHRITP